MPRKGKARIERECELTRARLQREDDLRIGRHAADLGAGAEERVREPQVGSDEWLRRSKVIIERLNYEAEVRRAQARNKGIAAR